MTVGGDLATAPTPSAVGGLVVPLVDVWMGLLSRQRPEGRLVPLMLKLTADRRIAVTAPVLARLAAAASDRRQADRVVRALAPFPILTPTVEDHLAGAALTHELRVRQVHLDGDVIVAWAMVRRIGARVWTADRTLTTALAMHGCPLLDE